MMDQVKSTRITTDDGGDVVYSAAHGPYGDIQKTWVDNDAPKLKFSGKERDEYSELDYFGARYHNHQLYRFISVDPIINKGEALVNPQLWNLYSYCRNNPISYFDPDGRLERYKKGANKGKIRFDKKGEATLRHKDGYGGWIKAKVEYGIVYADDGTKILAYKNISGDERFDTNCHGNSFADGEFIINTPEVAKILEHDGYKDTKKPGKGDIAMWKDKATYVHSAPITDVQNGSVEVNNLGGNDTKATPKNVNGAWGSGKLTYRSKNSK